MVVVLVDRGERNKEREADGGGAGSPGMNLATFSGHLELERLERKQAREKNVIWSVPELKEEF